MATASDTTGTLKDVNGALVALRTSLRADGFDLRAEGVEADGRVKIVLEATPEACMDCLVGENVLMGVLETSIRRERPDVGGIVLERKGFA